MYLYSILFWYWNYYFTNENNYDFSWISQENFVYLLCNKNDKT